MQETNQVMEKVMCSLCNHKHNLKESHIWDDEPKVAKKKQEAKPNPKPPPVVKKPVELPKDELKVFVCQICEDKRYHDHLDTDRKKAKLRKRKERSKK